VIKDSATDTVTANRVFITEWDCWVGKGWFIEFLLNEVNVVKGVVVGVEKRG
jgi:hypothetical protein